MFAFFAGALGAYAAFRFIRYRRYGGGWGHWGQGSGGGPGRGGFGGFGPRMFLRGFLERLDATPAQEKVVVEAAEELHKVAEAFRAEMQRTRETVAKTVRAETFDATALREAWARHDQVIADFRAAAVDGLRKVQEVLDPQQRQMLGDLVEGGWRGMAFGGHGGCHGHRRFGGHHGWRGGYGSGPGYAA